MQTDIEIAESTELKSISKVANAVGILENELIFYGKHKAKIDDKIFERLKNSKKGKLVLVTAVNPTPAGEGKTTVSIGLSQALNLIGKKSVLSLREPSLGPVFGIKGGATGGGYSQIMPMCDINLHFTGDIHAMTAANNLICAALDNHIYWGNSLNIDPDRILINRCLDINDRALRNIKIATKTGGQLFERKESFVITVATEIMAIMCLAKDIADLRKRLSNILVAYTKDGDPVFTKDLKIVGSLLVLLKDAFNPNLVQTLEGTPAIVHGGPFANIAHGCSSVRATELALKLSDYCVTEAGFGSDLGAEKFFDIKCRSADLKPDVVVLTVTVRALKYNGGVNDLELLKREDFIAVQRGLCNLGKHIENLKLFNVPIVVAINRFSTDTDLEISLILDYCENRGVEFSIVNVHSQGGKGGVDLANKVVSLAEKEKGSFSPLYNLDLSIEEKIEAISKKIYGAQNVEYTKEALLSLERIKALPEVENLPVCIAKTQYSLSDNKDLLGAPKNFTVTVKDIKPCLGAGFVVAYMGDIVTMPGLSKNPSAERIDLNDAGEIVGSF